VIRYYPKLFTERKKRRRVHHERRVHMKEEYTIKLKDDVALFALTVSKNVPMPLAETR